MGHISCLPGPVINLSLPADVAADAAGIGPESFAKRLTRIRKERRLTRRALALRAGVSYGGLLKMETGERVDPTLSSVRGLAHALEVSYARLIDGDI